MATVPGEADNNVTPLTGMAALPKALQPTQSDFLMAAAIMDRQGKPGPAEGVMAKPGQTVQPVDVGGNIAKVREEFGRAAAEMTGVADAVRAVRGEMTPEEAQTFALGAIPALVPGGKVAGEAAEVAPGVMRGIRAFHGSPFDFEKFSLANIGTGEGAQAYGHGLYFAEQPKVAEEYKAMLTQQPGTPEYYAQLHLNRAGGDVDEAKRTLFEMGGRRPNSPGYGEAINLLEGGWRPNPGKMYEVNINADPEHFLDWDKPLSEQPKEAYDIFRKLGMVGPNFTDEQIRAINGGSLGQSHTVSGPGGFNRFTSDQFAQEMKQAGIPGIKYLDQGSRSAQGDFERALQHLKYAQDKVAANPGDSRAQDVLDAIQSVIKKGPQQTHNYVVFDDKLIDIINKYGIAGLIAANVAHFKTGAGNGNGLE
jgi:hypothetical protein